MSGTSVAASNTRKAGQVDHQLLPSKRVPLTAEGSKFHFLLSKAVSPYTVSKYSKLTHTVTL